MQRIHCKADKINSEMPGTILNEDDMQAATHSTSSKAQRSWKHRIGLSAMVLVTAVASAIFGLSTLGAQPSPMAGSAIGAYTLSLQREVKEQDEAAFAASWATDRAAEQPAAGAPRPVEIKVIFATECGVDCLTLMWPDGRVSTTNVTIALDYAAICACPILMQPR